MALWMLSLRISRERDLHTPLTAVIRFSGKRNTDLLR